MISLLFIIEDNKICTQQRFYVHFGAKLMNMKLSKLRIPIVFYFIVTALLISYFFPREGKFKYQFYEGKPWRYGLLTAAGDFPIYKTEAEVEAEKDSVLHTISPYFKMDEQIKKDEIEKLRENYISTLIHKKITASYMRYVENSLSDLYGKGIISPEELNKLNQDKTEKINLVINNISQQTYVSDLFTVKSAYQSIIDNCPPYLDQSTLKSCDINNYLTENVFYDEAMTQKVKEERIKNIPLASGMVQAGERIVDRGEIVDTHIYNVLRSMKILYESKAGGKKRDGMMMAGQFVMVVSIIACFALYLWSFRLRLYKSRKNVSFMLLCILTACLLTELDVTYSLFNVYILPYAIVPIVVRTFFDSRTALFTHLCAVMICSLMVPFPHEFLVLQIIAGMVVTFSLRDLSQRSQLIRCSFLIFLSYAIAYLALTMYQDADFTKINWSMFLYFGINFILLMFSYLLVYMLEKAFGYISSITLVELSNINTPILKKLSESCPGTFQHSLQVSILASEAANKIGANAQLVRTGAMYHDIGKMANPAFFTENQASVNPHSQLNFDQSAEVIISHVTEGVKIAEKARLPKAIISFIRTHHGKGKAKYFYNSFKNMYPDKEINDELFTYPGPNPYSKETAILMMADAVEAASRSLKEYTEESIQQLVNKIIDGQVADGLMRNAPLTFRDVETVKEVFTEKLKTMYHTRVSYPDLKK